MSARGTIMASIGIGVALTLIVLACALDDVWYPLFMLIPLILTPLPALLISQGSADDPGYGNPDGIAYIHWASVGAFLVSFFIVSAFGLISVFFHLQIVTAQAFWLSISGVLVVLLTGALSASNLSCNCGRRGGASSQALLF